MPRVPWRSGAFFHLLTLVEIPAPSLLLTSPLGSTLMAPASSWSQCPHSQAAQPILTLSLEGCSSPGHLHQRPTRRAPRVAGITRFPSQPFSSLGIAKTGCLHPRKANTCLGITPISNPIPVRAVQSGGASAPETHNPPLGAPLHDHRCLATLSGLAFCAGLSHTSDPLLAQHD